VDNQQSSSGGSTGTSSNDESTNEDQKLFSQENHKDGIDDTSRYILIQQDGKYSMFQVIEGNEALDVSVLPSKLHPIGEYDTQGAAIAALMH
jgi:hypothetical protein